MGLSSSSLATRIENNIASAFGVSVNADMHKYALAMASAIVAEIQANATVSVSYLDNQPTPIGSGTDVTRTTTGTIS